MIKHIKQNTDAILLESKPSGMLLSDYRHKLLSGEFPLSQSQQDRILRVSAPLSDYGHRLARLNGIKIDGNDLASSFAFGAIHSQGLGLGRGCAACVSTRSGDDLPGTTPDDGGDVTVNGEITWAEVGACARNALGLDLGWAIFRPLMESSWTYMAIRKAFTGIAKRALGPIGVAIVIVEFSWCIIEAGAAYEEGDPIDEVLPEELAEL